MLVDGYSASVVTLKTNTQEDFLDVFPVYIFFCEDFCFSGAGRVNVKRVLVATLCKCGDCYISRAEKHYNIYDR